MSLSAAGLLRQPSPAQNAAARRSPPLALLVQGAIVLIVLAYEGSELAGVAWPFNAQEFAPLALFALPMLYVARGLAPLAAAAMVTGVLGLAAAQAALTFTAWDRAADGMQVGLIGVVAVAVGWRVEHERRVRQQAEATSAALRRSEARYRALFAHTPAPILVVGRDDGVVRELNTAARAWFGSVPLGDWTLPALIGAAPAAQVLAGAAPETLTVRGAGSAELIVRPRCTPLDGADGGALVQIVLQDVTEERFRQRRQAAFSAALLRGLEEERRRLAHEIHDEPIQALISLERRLDMLAQRAETPPSVLTALDGCRDLAAQIGRELRELARGLRPPSLDDLGLLPSLRQLAQRCAERTGIPVTLTVRGEERRLSADAELACYRIAQEALRNVERHAAARRATVRVSFGADVMLSIRDDGRGFALDAAAAREAGGHFGLLGMQERAAAIGGRLLLRSAPGRGATVAVVLPGAA